MAISATKPMIRFNVLFFLVFGIATIFAALHGEVVPTVIAIFGMIWTGAQATIRILIRRKPERARWFPYSKIIIK